MSILIKGMEMPKNCAECPLNHDAECAVKNCMVIDDCYVRRALWCPLVPVPPHGRLIDADELMKRFYKEEKAADEHGRDFTFSFKSAGENCAEWWTVQGMLEDAPTIIPADKEGE